MKIGMSLQRLHEKSVILSAVIHHYINDLNLTPAKRKTYVSLSINSPWNEIYQNMEPSESGSGHEGVATLLPGFVIIW